MNLYALEIFVAAVEEQSLSKAAERENLAISTVSKRIKELERSLHRTLLLRHGRGVEPTPAGTLLYQRAKAILKSVALAEKAISGFSTDGVAKLRVAANPSTLLQFLPQKMARFLSSHDHVTVNLLEGHSYDIPRLVVEHEVDIGIYHARHPAPGVHSHPFATDRVGLVVPIGHPLASRDRIYFEEALDFDLLGYFPRHSLEQFLQYVGSTITRPPTVKLQVSNFETRCRMIREGLGVGIVPEIIAHNYLASMGLVLVRLEDDWSKRNFFACISDPDNCPDIVLSLLHFLLPQSNGPATFNHVRDGLNKPALNVTLATQSTKFS